LRRAEAVFSSVIAMCTGVRFALRASLRDPAA